MFGLSHKDISVIKKIIYKHSNVEKIIIFGSRARGDYQRGSDVDLVILGKNLEKVYTEIKSDLRESNLIYKFDIIVHEKANEKLKKEIDNYGKAF